MSQETKDAIKASSLKDLNKRLNEIYTVLDDVNAKLEFLARNTPSDKATEDKSPSEGTATLEGLHVIADKIGRKSSNIARSTNMIVGS